MQIHLPKSIAKKISRALYKAGDREIGGILMGEYLAPGLYRITNLTIQTQGGTVASFWRSPFSVLDSLQVFFQKTGNQFTRFNYLGEWHSHPLYSTIPSNTDRKTMWEIISDPDVGANFAVLLIVRLGDSSQLEGTVNIFLPNYQCFTGNLIYEG
jgi:[CysO sulfur-carrier protein]-S-L-cysteine hydrolase